MIRGIVETDASESLWGLREWEVWKWKYSGVYGRHVLTSGVVWVNYGKNVRL